MTVMTVRDTSVVSAVGGRAPNDAVSNSETPWLTIS